MSPVQIRPYRNEDAEQMALLANNVNVSALLRDNFPSPYALRDAEEWIEFANDPGQVNSFQKAIAFHSELVGGIGVLRNSDIYRNTAEIGYWLGEPFWSKGIMIEAVSQMTDWAFENVSITKLYAGVFESNPASMRVLEKAGYELEAIHKKAIVKGNDLFDEYYYVKFRS